MDLLSRSCKLGARLILLVLPLDAAHTLQPPVPAQETPQGAIRLREKLAVGHSIEVNSSVNLRGSMTEKADKKESRTAITASAAARYLERMLELSDDGSFAATARRYLVATLDKKSGDSRNRIVLRAAVERVIVRRTDDQSTVFSPDGPLTVPELDMLRADAFTPALRGLLPGKPVKTGDQWQATPDAASELTGIGPIQSGGLACTLSEIKKADDRAVARVTLAGSITGPSEQGPSRLKVEGHFLFDLDQQLITRIILTGRSEILGADGQTIGELDGRYEIERRPTIDDPQLTDLALPGDVRKPTPETTALLFDSSELALQFRYPRNWELKSVTAKVVQLREPTGGVMRLSIDPPPSSTAEKLRTDLLTWVRNQKGSVTDSGRIEPSPASDPTGEQFTVRAKIGDKSSQWTYVVVRVGDRGCTIAANLTDERAPVLRDDVSFVAHRLEFLRRSGK